MNRLAHLRETLPKNILDNKDYPNIEFVLLNYNSQDELDNWVKENMMSFINDNILKYYVTDKPEFFSMSHSKNLALKLATGDILCTIDADNYTGPGYARWVDSIFEEKGAKTVICTSEKDRIDCPDAAGKFCFHRDLFFQVNGFDESMIGYGMEDIDFLNRLGKAGGTSFFLQKENLQFIGHTMESRMENYHLTKSLERIYVKYPETTRQHINVIYMLKDGSFFQVTYENVGNQEPDQSLDHFFGWVLKDGAAGSGSFFRRGILLAFIYDTDTNSINYVADLPDLSAYSADGDQMNCLKEVKKGTEWHEQLVMAYGGCMNRNRYRTNDRQNNSQVNIEGWGKGEVYLDNNRSVVRKIE